MDPIYYTINIPLSPLELETPDTTRTTVSTTMSAIKIIVRPGSHVTVNGKDYSDTVSSQTGEMTYNATIQPIGDNVFTIVVRSQYCRDNTLDVVFYRARQDIPLDLAVGTYGTTDQKVMKVSATTLPGAYVEVLTPYSDLNITELDSTGKFTFNAIFDKIGNNTISIVASYPGKSLPRSIMWSIISRPPMSIPSKPGRFPRTVMPSSSAISASARRKARSTSSKASSSIRFPKNPRWSSSTPATTANPSRWLWKTIRKRNGK